MSGSQINYVVTGQPMPGGGRGLLVGSIKVTGTGHLDCFPAAMMSSCLLTSFCPGFTLCKISTRTGDTCAMVFCLPGGLNALRARIRTLGGIQGSICTDCLTNTFCPQCSLCQMKRELDAMGL